MTTQSAPTPWTVQALLDLFEVERTAENLFTAQTGPAGEQDRQVVEGTQVLAQAIVAAAQRFPDKSIRSVYAVFARAVMVGAGPVQLEIDVISEGRSTASAVITATQNGKRCITVTVLADVPSADVIRHQLPRPTSRHRAGPPVPDADDRPGGAAGRRRGRQQPRRGRAAGALGLAALRPDPRPRRPRQGADRVLHRSSRHLDDHARARGDRHQPGASDGVHGADDGVGEFPRTGAVGRLAALLPREHAGRRRDVLRPRDGAHRGRRPSRVVHPGRPHPPLRTTDTSITEQSRL